MPLFQECFLQTQTICQTRRSNRYQYIYQPQDKPFTSSDEQHPNTESYLKSQSPVPFGGSSVDSAEDGSLNNREDKIPLYVKPCIYNITVIDHRLFAVGFIDKTELRPVSSRNKVNIIIATLFEIWNTRNNYTIL